MEDQGWVAWFVIAALTGRPIMIHGDGRQVRDVLYVGCLVRGFHLFPSSDIRHVAFNMGGGPTNTLSLLELLGLLWRLTGKTPVSCRSGGRPTRKSMFRISL